jgi:nickel-dependent lactate racemase
MRQVVELPYGSGTLSAEVPERNLVGVYLPQPVPACADPEGEIARALAAPLGTPPLRALVRRGETVVVLLDDHTRATPAARILPLVLEELRQGGVREEDVTLLITHGTHRLSTEAEVRAKVGPEIARRFRVEQHRCTDESQQVYIGLTSRGTPVWVNRTVVEADRRVGIGHIGPSPYAGYSGGYKLILPGAAALETINVNHSLVPLGFRQPGRVDVPCRLDMDEAGRMVGLDFVVDVVLFQDERVVRAVEYADAIVRPGGSILLVAACPEGVGGDDFYRLMANPARRPDDFLRDVARRNGMVTVAVLGYALARIKAEKRLYMVTDGIPPAALESMGIVSVPSLQAGIDHLLGQYGPEARLAVFPMGSSTIPCRPQGSGKVPC